jgi:2-C-methyl-D-erythritol 4-phosphate cytidylyltransferase
MLLLAAGRGTRFGGPVPKAWLPLGGRPLLARSAERLAQALPAGMTAEWIALVHPDDRATFVARHRADVEAAAGAAVRFVDGGASRQESMQNGLAACGDDVDLVLVHDAARALLPVAPTRACIAAAAAHGAALLALPAPDTLKKVSPEGLVAGTVDRSGVWLAQTPQVIRRDLLLRAMAAAARAGFTGTDDVSLVERLGEPVAVVRGAPTNLKITTADDLPLAEAIVAAGLA